MAQSRPPADIVAAGAVVWRTGREVLLVHRPRYDDWSFPKGKLDPDEPAAVAAAREVFEETGLQVRLGSPLASQRYTVTGGRSKDVHYWVGRVVGHDDVSIYRPNDEIDAVAWVPAEAAATRLTYRYDRVTLAEARRGPAKTQVLVVVRHGAAEPRKTWTSDDRLRPLAAAGHREAERLAPLLAAYGVTTVATSSSTRCVQTVEPFADAAGLDLEEHDCLSEEGASGALVGAVVEGLLDGGPSVLCTHRPVLPLVFEALGLEQVKLDPAELLVLHHRKGRIVAVERSGP